MGQGLAALPVVEGPWVGGVTSNSAVVVAKLNTARFSNLEVSTDQDFSRNESFSELRELPDSPEEMSRYRLSRLRPDTRYYYRIRTGRERDTRRTGSFRTLPAENTPASFRFAFGSAAVTGSEGGSFLEIKYHDPAFFLHTGDLHSETIARNEPDAFRAAYENVLNSSTQAELYRNLPFVYTWDGHDYGPEGSDRLSPGRPAAQQIYREYVPHYPLPADEELAAAPLADRPISQAFTVGRVRFILLDTRSQRDPADQLDNAEKTMLGAWQRGWLKRQLLAAKETSPLIFIVSSVSWISDDTETGDNWGRYTTERRALSDWMVANEITGVCFLGGDGHMLAADDGSHDTYASDGGPGFPALQAAPLDQTGSIKGGPWSVAAQVPTNGEGHFGLVSVDDRLSELHVTFQGLNQSGNEKMRLEFTVPAR